jgi:ketosteroid isomerase-like protein
MKKILLLSLLYAFQAKDTAREKALAGLVEAERSFAAASVAKGIRAAFLEYLADDAVVFLPEPMNGKEGYSNRPESEAELSWYPAYADISASLDWGYTTGPYEFRAKPEDEKPVGAGFYLSVWKKQPDGQWKVAVDQGSSFPVEQIKEESYSPAKASGAGKQAKGNRQQLLQQDTATAQAYRPETLIYRAGVYPHRYKEGKATPESKVSYTTLGHDIAPAADMAYTYGSYTLNQCGQAQTGYYLKVWKVLDGQWKLAAHNLVPIKKP